MSLRFCYFPPKPIRIVRHRRIRFIIGTPNVTFSTIKQVQKPETKVMKEYQEKEWKSVQEKESPPQRKEKKAAKVNLQMSEYSMNGCFELLQNLQMKKSIKQIVEIKGSEKDSDLGFSKLMGDVLDLKQIEDKLVNCEYNSIKAFFEDLDNYFNYVSTICGSTSLYPEYGRTAYRVLKEIKNLSDNYEEHNNDVVNKNYGRFRSVEEKLKEFTNVNLGEIGISCDKIDLKELSAKLNKLEGKNRTRAEYIVKIYCPFIPYYASWVDLKQLPYTAIDSLSKLVNA